MQSLLLIKKKSHVFPRYIIAQNRRNATNFPIVEKNVSENLQSVPPRFLLSLQWPQPTVQHDPTATGRFGQIRPRQSPRRQDKSYTEACKKDFLLFFTSVQKKRPFCFNKSGRESRTADPVFPSCDPKCRCREASWLAIPLDRDLSKELPAFLIFIIHQ